MVLFFMIRIRVFLCLAAVLLSNCASNTHDINGPGMPLRYDIIVNEMGYNDKGLPVPGRVLDERPSQPGQHFTVVQMADDRPLVSYDIAVVRGKPDFNKPLEAIYEWTGKGFLYGITATDVLFSDSHFHIHSASELAGAAAVMATPAAIGGIAGFVIGVGDGAFQTVQELGKFVHDDEQVLTCTRYDYDIGGRLLRMRMFTSDMKKELVRTNFEYFGKSPVPTRATVESFVEGKERVVK